MPFACPDCGRKSMEIVLAMELTSDSRSDEITLQVIECSRCGFTGIAVYEESRRGALGREVFEHTGFRAGKATLEEINKSILSCPQRKNERCDCPAHHRLGSQDKYGRWSGLSGLDLYGIFAMVYSHEEP